MDFDRTKANLEQNLANLRQKLPQFNPKLPKFAKPGLPTTEDVVGWFSLDEKRLADILQQVRSSLPTTEAILVGKPQAGKSSIVRAITGVAPDIVGQGYQPHTRHTERYSFPDAELPLLVFTDTVGLGDGQSETSEVVQELLGTVELDKRQAKVMILTVKINDFATDTLRTIAQSIRSRHPEIPCLLAVTCLHEAYPDVQMDHPAYPPEIAEVDRAFAQIRQDFAGLFDRAILVDFTLEEDGCYLRPRRRRCSSCLAIVIPTKLAISTAPPPAAILRPLRSWLALWQRFPYLWPPCLF
jgi:GTP-binding protein EngB required for normal cell division